MVVKELIAGDIVSEEVGKAKLDVACRKARIDIENDERKGESLRSIYIVCGDCGVIRVRKNADSFKIIVGF